MKMKKAIAVLCLVCCIFSFSTVAFAASEPISSHAVEFSAVESAKMTYIESASNRLSIKNNVASVRAYVYGYSGTTKSEVSVRLQVKTLGLFWTTVETWSDSQYGDRAYVSGSTAVTAGKSYRTVATVTVWNGTNSESRTLTSETIKALRSNFSTWNRFEEAVQINGTGYDDYQNQWYRYNPNGSIIAVSGPNNTSSGTTPTEYRTIAVDSPYITRRQYTSDGSGGSVYHRGKVIIEGLSNASGDNGYRTAEDSGGAINGYHIDLFIGFKTVSQFSSIYGTYIPTSSGHYFPQVRYYSTLVNSY